MKSILKDWRHIQILIYCSSVVFYIIGLLEILKVVNDGFTLIVIDVLKTKVDGVELLTLKIIEVSRILLVVSPMVFSFVMGNYAFKVAQNFSVIDAAKMPPLSANLTVSLIVQQLYSFLLPSSAISPLLNLLIFIGSLTLLITCYIFFNSLLDLYNEALLNLNPF